MVYKEIIEEVAESMDLTPSMVDRIYKAYWKGIREHIKNLPLKEDLTDEEFLKLRPNINIPSIGKLYVTLERYHNLKLKEQIIQDKFKNRNVTHKEN